MTKNRLVTVSYLILVFGSGSLVGAVAHRLYMTSTVTASVAPKTPAQTRQEFLAKLRTRVGASETQVAQVNAVLDDAKRKYSELDLQNKPSRDRIDQERVAAILAVLTPKQQDLFRAWREEVRAKREKKALEEKAANQQQPVATPTR